MWAHAKARACEGYDLGCEREMRAAILCFSKNTNSL